jgi:hypothetical protein
VRQAGFAHGHNGRLELRDTEAAARLDEATESLLTPERIRLFTSHTSDHRFDVTGLPTELNRFAFAYFVAHDVIEPSRQWQEVIELALGLGTSESKHAPLPRAIVRLVRFGLAKRLTSGQLAVRCVVGPISQHQLSSLSVLLQMLHREIVSRDGRAGDPGPPASAPSPTADQRAG